jgi:hypothetical protein
MLQGITKTPAADSLIQVYRITHESRARARLLLKISQEEELRDPGKALQYARQALKIAQIAEFDSAEVRAMIHMGIDLCRMNLLKEAIETGEQVVEKASKYNMNLEIADGRSIMAVAYAQGGDYDNSSKLNFENLKLYEKLNEKRLLGSTMGNIGADFSEQQSYQKALEYANKALAIGIEINDLPLVTDQYNNLASIYQLGFKDNTKAIRNYFRAFNVALKIEDFQQQGTILLNVGRVFMELNNSDSALLYINKSILIFKKLNDPVLLAEGYSVLGNYYYQKGEMTHGKKNALASLEIAKRYGILHTIYDASDLLHKICLSENDTSGAYRYLKILTNAQDSLYTLQNQKELFKLEFQYNQDKKVKEQKIRQIKYYALLGFIILGLLSVLAIIFLLYSRQKIKIKNAILEKEKAESTLRFKSKELSINLLALLKKNELITEISQKVAEFEKAAPGIDLKEAAIRLNQEIKLSSDDRLWQEFSTRFKETNSEFYDKLLSKYPDLSQGELKLCAYLRLNMSTKEIADLTGQRTESLETARYRLRKKFGLTNSESNLVTFLSKI